MKIALPACLLVAFAFAMPCFAQNILINEILSVNNNGILDEDGDHSDWLELFNDSSEPISLDGFYLSDLEEDPYLFALPDVEMLPGEFLLVFCSGKNRSEEWGEIHSNFSISSSENSISLMDNSGGIAFAPVNYQGDNLSCGSFPDGDQNKINFSTPTPGYSNLHSNGSNQVLFSAPGGMISESFVLEMNSLHPEGIIRYSINGEEPDSSSNLYSQGLLLSQEMKSSSEMAHEIISPPEYQNVPPEYIQRAIVIRAACFDSSGNQTSGIETHTYLIESEGVDHKELPVVSICAEFNDLMNDSSGIFTPGIHFEPDNPLWTGNYYQTGREWEKDAHFEFHHPLRDSYSSAIGLRTHGGNSRRHPQKGMRIYARSEYGNKKFRYPFFEDKKTKNFKRLVFKPMSASWNDAGLQDLICNQLALNEELNFRGLQTEPVVVYVNGIYWGVYLMQERIDEHFMEEHFDVQEDQFDLIGNWFGVTEVGSSEEWLELYQFIETNDLSEENNYLYVSSQIDLENFIDYQLFQAFIANQDWPANNMMCWKQHGAGNKWQWIFKDGDGGLQRRELSFLEHSLSTSDEFWPTNAYSTLFLRKLLENDTFDNMFYARFSQLLTNDWKYDLTSTLYNNGVNSLHDEVELQHQRFPVIANYSDWLVSIDQVNFFLQIRACNLKEQLYQDLQKHVEVPRCYYPETGLGSLSVYPNPNDGDFTFSFESSLSKNLLIKVRNLQGQIIHQIAFPASSGTNSIALSYLNLPSGIYLLEVQADRDQVMTKFIINR